MSTDGRMQLHLPNLFDQRDDSDCLADELGVVLKF